MRASAKYKGFLLAAAFAERQLYLDNSRITVAGLAGVFESGISAQIRRFFHLTRFDLHQNRLAEKHCSGNYCQCRV